MTKITLETEWGISDNIIVTKETNESHLNVSEMLYLMIDVMKGYGYQEENIFEALTELIEEFKHWQKTQI